MGPLGFVAIKSIAYIETSVIGYLAARRSRDVVAAACREVTREWWSAAAGRLDPFAPEPAATEAGAGDPAAASARLDALEPVTLPGVTGKSETLARLPVDLRAVPRQSAADAAHIAIAATNGVDYPVAWNFRHIANAAMRSRIEGVCRQAGHEPPVIRMPGEPMESEHADDTA